MYQMICMSKKVRRNFKEGNILDLIHLPQVKEEAKVNHNFYSLNQIKKSTRKIPKILPMSKKSPS